MVSHNEVWASVAGNVFQAGAVHGDVVMLPREHRQGVDALQAELIRHLAGEVRTQSAQELRQWGIRDRDALSVRWHTATEDLLDHWENIHGSSEVLSLAGHFTAIRTTYKAIQSKRLVILGGAGTGKTVLAHRLILDLIGDADPVPVLFSLSEWNPATGLSRWIGQQLARDFSFLGASEIITGKRQADLLVERGLILPVLDGFDELPEQHRRAAIGEISRFDVPLILTSRPDEYARATRGVKAIGGAAAIELENLSLEDAHHYLRRRVSRTRSVEWDAVFDHLRTQPDDTASRNLARVLTTPLMVTLAETVHGNSRDHRPPALLDSLQFPSSEAIEDHLLGAYLDAVYERRTRGGDAEGLSPGSYRARRWLGYLANHLEDRNAHDLDWWRLPVTLRRSTRILVTSAGLALVLGMIGHGVYWSGYAMLAMFGSDVFSKGMFGEVAGFALSASGYAFGLTFWITGGLATGMAVGLVNESKFVRGRLGREPERLRLFARRQGRAQRSWLTRVKNFFSESAGGFVVAIAIGIMVESGGGLAATPLHRISVGVFGGIADGIASSSIYAFLVGLGCGVILGLVYGLVNVVVTALGDPFGPDATTPWVLLARDRVVTLVRTVTVVLVVGLVVGFMYGSIVVDFEEGFEVGIGIAILSGLARIALSAWGIWLLFVRLWLPLTGRLPWRPKLFLEDAYRRGVLRRNGASYQFRHARIRDHLRGGRGVE
ncbi:hypothetical protein BJ969_000117 [Saccharopolyspora gloriosae]|uniref:NACHT domain-containing protein n=1 Tax=Saccharopolyspora gloriosae TaxID=455344 RepID=A0A840NCF9_9PSEU|nr:hypothetical protein [Saccharopolyspora gloriosae]